jgi:hypothetical protein
METVMENFKKSEYELRDSIVKLLSDGEIARVSTTEAGTHLSDDEEYLDLEHCSAGIHRAKSKTSPMGRILSQNSVSEKTWNAILAKLASASAAK